MKIEYLVKPDFDTDITRRKKDPNETRFLDHMTPWAGQWGPAFGIVGVPFDGAVIGRKGTRGGPKRVRESLKYYTTYDFDLDLDLAQFPVYDLGNVKVLHENVLETHKRLQDIIEQIVSMGIIPVVLGGDHSLTYATASGVKKGTGKSLGLVNIDSHFDVREVYQGDITSGTPFRRLVEEDVIVGKNLVEIGVRGFTNSPQYRQWCEKHEISAYSVLESRRIGLKEVVKRAIETALDGVEAYFLSVDMDVLDQFYSPGVSAPTSGGFRPEEVLELIAGFARGDILGIDILEVNPMYDTRSITSNCAARIALQFMSNYLKKNWEESKEP